MSESEFRERQAERAGQMARLDQAISECRTLEVPRISHEGWERLHAAVARADRQLRRREMVRRVGWWLVYSVFAAGMAWGVVRLLRGWVE